METEIKIEQNLSTGKTCKLFDLTPYAENALELTWDDIVNAPVSDVNSVTDWNTFFDLPTFGGLFHGVLVNGNIVKLYGGNNIFLKDGIFSDPPFYTGNQNIVSVEDNALCIIGIPNESESQFNRCHLFTTFKANASQKLASAMFFEDEKLESVNAISVIEMFDYVFYGCIVYKNFNYPLLESITSLTGSAYTFYGCVSVEVIYMPKLITMGQSVTDDTVFGNISGQAIEATFPIALQTCNSGGLHASLQVLSDNNTVTFIWV